MAERNLSSKEAHAARERRLVKWGRGGRPGTLGKWLHPALLRGSETQSAKQIQQKLRLDKEQAA